MKRLCFVEYDMTVTGGVEQVTTSLANAFCDAYEVYIYGIFGKGKHVPYDLDPRIHYRAELAETAESENGSQVYLNHLRSI
ncbi:MAG: hypothetical protein ACLROG_15980 [Coprococcus phoceensis]